MCTLLGYRDQTAQRFLLGSNRDELFHRVIDGYFDADGLFFPLIADAAGRELTWMGISDQGLLGILLYLTTDFDQERVQVSRGVLVPQLLREGVGSLEELDPEPFGPFQLLTYDAQTGRMQTFDWDQREYTQSTVDDSLVVRTASSYGYAAAKRDRMYGLLEGHQGGPEGVTLATMHELLRDHAPGHVRDGAQSACMHGTRSQTLTSTVVEATSAQITYRAINGFPCQHRGEYPVLKAFSL